MTIALVHKKNKSYWKSCQSITDNLKGSYHILAKDLERELISIETDSSLSEYDGQKLAKKILEAGAEYVSFIDHHPHPISLIQGIDALCESEKKDRPTLIFHIFGDFVLNAVAWQACGDLLKKFKVQFIAASHKQASLLESFFAQGEEVEVIPFPVSDLEYFYSEEVREKTREAYQWGDDLIFLYTGRLSYQKNITDLIHIFSYFQSHFNQKVRLVLAGPMDDLAVPYLGKEALPGTFYFHWEEALNSCENSDRITFLGNLSQEELFKLYNGADCYISLSAHHDEDYGMSPAEALCSGLPCVLSQWGGFSSFAHYLPGDVELVEIERGNDRNYPHSKQCFKMMAAQSMKSYEADQRRDLSINAHEKLGIRAVSQQLIPVFQNKNRKNFLGLNSKFFKLAAQFENNPQSPFRSASGGYSLFYREIYDDYSKKVVKG